MDSCIFCKIANGEIPCAKVFEGDRMIAFLDISPVNTGHTLVIPKEHFETMLDLPEELLAELTSTTKMVSSMVKNATKAHGFNIMMNNYEAAGQVVPHAHVHIVPRFKDDGLKMWPGNETSPEELNKIKDKITSYMQL
jgi:histidine triad (HIT) family protein